MPRYYKNVICAALMSYVFAEVSAHAATEQIVYSFQGGNDGARPYSGPINIGDTLYGTTYLGGADNAGTVFSVTPSGTETVLHAFAGGSDGAYPWSSLTHFHGKLYGTASGGGANGFGAVFAMSESGEESVVYPFAGVDDGIEPLGRLIAVDGTLYGTTYAGGGYSCFDNDGCGTVYSVTPTGTERVLYAFEGGSDGSEPFGALTYANKTFYGTSDFGGRYSSGIVFAVTQTGAEKLVHSFKGGRDGDETEAGLLNVNGTLYGTTLYGGGSGCDGGGCGTVFSISPGGKEKIVYAFQGGNDGAVPTAGLVAIHDTLYGVTYEGGAANLGTVFSLTPRGAEKTLYVFQGGNDGAGAVGLINVGGMLYGNTSAGGGSGCSGGGCGTVFLVKP